MRPGRSLGMPPSVSRGPCRRLRGWAGLVSFTVAVTLAGMLLACPAPAGAESPAGDDLSAYQRFVIHPRLARGIEAQRHGDHGGALAQFERARQLAPASVVTALYLAYALRQAGDRPAARRVLEEQLRLTPRHPKLMAALADDAPWLPPPLSPQEQAALARAEQQQELAVLDLQRRQEVEDRIADLRRRIAAGQVDEADALMAKLAVLDPVLRTGLDRDLAQRAIHLQHWSVARAAFDRIDEAGLLSASDARQWLQVCLAGGDTGAARSLLGKPLLQGTTPLLMVARVMQARGETAALQTLVVGRWPRFEQADEEAEWLRFRAAGLPNEPQVTASLPLRFASNRPLRATLVLPALMAQGRFDDAGRMLAELPADQGRLERFALASARDDRIEVERVGGALVRDRPDDLALLDRVSYQLVRLAAAGPAVDLLVAAWPFGAHLASSPPSGRPAPSASGTLAAKSAAAAAARPDTAVIASIVADPALRLRLIDRLVELVDKAPALVPIPARAPLAVPLADALLRERQALMFSAWQDCAAIRRLLGDFAGAYRAPSWVRLARCYREAAPGLAQYALAEALAREPTAPHRLALAYQAYEVEDYRAASEALKPLDARVLDADQLLAAGDDASLERWLARYEQAGDDANDDRYWWWRARLAEPGRPDRALEAIGRAIAIRPAVDYYQLQARLLERRGDAAGARDALERALALKPDDPTLLTALALAHADAGDPVAAAAVLARVATRQPDNPAIDRQLTWFYLRAGDLSAARAQARRVIDELDRDLATVTASASITVGTTVNATAGASGTATTTAGARNIDGATVSDSGGGFTRVATWPDDSTLAQARRDDAHAFRRLHETLGRRWTFAADAWVGNQLSYSGRSGEPGTAYRGYSQAELDYRLLGQAGSGDAALSLFSRVFASSGAGDSAWPLHRPTLGVGLRWKPLVDRVLYLAIEPQLPLGDRDGRRSDLLLRASASLFGDGPFGDDWHPRGRGWFARNLYLDLARYVRDQRWAFTADLRGSYHWKLAEARTLEPYAHLQYSGIRGDDIVRFDKDLRAGLGLRLNQWQGASRYDAWPTRLSAGIEIQHAFRSFLPERNVVLFMLRGRW